MNKCPTKSEYLQSCLCEIWYPYGCGTKCRNMFKNWLKQSDEVADYHYKAERKTNEREQRKIFGNNHI